MFPSRILETKLPEVIALNSMFLTEHIKGMWVYMPAYICILSIFDRCSVQVLENNWGGIFKEMREGVRKEQDEKAAWEDYKSEKKFGLIKDSCAPYICRASCTVLNSNYRRPGFKCGVKWSLFQVFKVDCEFNNCVLNVLRLTTSTAWFLYRASSTSWTLARCFLQCHARLWIS